MAIQLYIITVMALMMSESLYGAEKQQRGTGDFFR